MRFCCVLCLLLLLSACAAPVADQVALKSGSSIDRSEVSNILGDQDFYVFFDIEGGEIAIDSVQESEMSGKQNDIYAYNRKTLQASNVDLKKAKLKECVKISGVGQYATCYSGTPPKGEFVFRDISGWWGSLWECSDCDPDVSFYCFKRDS